MSREHMLELAQRTAELVVESIKLLPDVNAWDGDFRSELVDRFVEVPPENGRPALEVIEDAAKEILPKGLRLDHPRSFGFIPNCPTWLGILADFLISGFNTNQASWLSASGNEPSRTDGNRLVSSMAGISRLWRGFIN